MYDISNIVHISRWCTIYFMTLSRELSIGLYRENAITIESEEKDPFGGNVYYVTMQIMLHIPDFARKERNWHCDVIAAIQTSR